MNPSPIAQGEAAPAHPSGVKLIALESFEQANFGLRHSILSPIETLAQSISTIAPSTSPALTVPLVFALAGQGTAIAYIIATALMVIISLTIAPFARESSSPGSLFSYARLSLPPVLSSLTAWALFFAYITTASAVIGGFVFFSGTLLGDIGIATLSPFLAKTFAFALVAVAAIGAGWVAFRDIQISARLMLYIEGISVFLIAIVIALVLIQHGFHFDHAQFSLHDLSFRGIGLGVMLAIFSFVGFESATTLGAEAKDPLRSIPRAVIQSAVLSGTFFVIASYGETLGFHTSHTSLDQSPAPFHYLATQAGVSNLGVIIDIGVLVSMFAATLACVIAASRVLLLMAHHGLASKRLAAALALHGATGADIYGWMGTLAVYGFLTAYGMVAIALLVHRIHQRRRTLGILLLTGAATLAMLAAMASNIYPIPPSPLCYFPYIYAAYLAIALMWLAFKRQRRETSRPG
jgi:amino acid transporter